MALIERRQETDLARLRTGLNTRRPSDLVNGMLHGLDAVLDIHSNMNDLHDPAPGLISRARSLSPIARRFALEMRHLSTSNPTVHAQIIGLNSDFNNALNNLTIAQRIKVLQHISRMEKKPHE